MWSLGLQSLHVACLPRPGLSIRYPAFVQGNMDSEPETQLSWAASLNPEAGGSLPVAAPARASLAFVEDCAVDCPGPDAVTVQHRQSVLVPGGRAVPLGGDGPGLPPGGRPESPSKRDLAEPLDCDAPAVFQCQTNHISMTTWAMGRRAVLPWVHPPGSDWSQPDCRRTASAPNRGLRLGVPRGWVLEPISSS